MDEPKEQGKENLWSFNLLSISISIREAAMFCLTCIGQMFATLSLIYWPACLIIVCMYLINTRVFQKKKTYKFAQQKCRIYPFSRQICRIHTFLCQKSLVPQICDNMFDQSIYVHFQVLFCYNFLSIENLFYRQTRFSIDRTDFLLIENLFHRQKI